ncbi:MAG: hypothetical protein ACE144_16445 [Thermodesulfobacteriota bacterium]
MIIGGALGDRITGGPTDDVVFGDGGYVWRDAGSVVTKVESLDPAVGGTDTIFGNEGDDIILGGAGDDIIYGNDGHDVIFGDNGAVQFGSGVKRINSIDEGIGGNDTINGNSGDDILLGGAASDTIYGNSGDDIILGDSGVVVRSDTSTQANDIFSTEAGIGGTDTIYGNEGDDIILGGAAGDELYGNGDNDIILGDSGYITRNSSDAVEKIETTAPSTGGVDIIEANVGDNVVFGGADADMITSDEGSDLILGDNGFALFDTTSSTAVLIQIETSDPIDGGNDQICAGNGPDVVMGGSADDLILAGGSDAASDIVLGDNGEAHFVGAFVLQEIFSTAPELGGKDIITAGNGPDVVIGGSQRDIVLGAADDTASIAFLDLLGTEWTITPAVVADLIATGAGDEARDVVLGDSGRVEFFNDGLNTPHVVKSVSPETGDIDIINTGNGPDVVMGGSGDDLILAGGSDAASDIILGENGEAVFIGAFVLKEIYSTAPEAGGSDIITTGNGPDVVIGGSLRDIVLAAADDAAAIGFLDLLGTDWTITPALVGDLIATGAGDEARDVVLGDSGSIEFFNDFLNTPRVIQTISPEIGDTDIINTGNGPDVVLGGSGDDLILAGGSDAASDIVLGDNGEAVFIGAFVLKEIYSIAPEAGGSDIITTGNGPDVVIGGSERDIALAAADDASAIAFLDLLGREWIITPGLVADLIATGAGDEAQDVVLADNGRAVFVDGVLTEIGTTSPENGDDDIINVGNGPDVVLGGSGGDLILAGGDDAAADVVLGDNGVATFSEDGMLIDIHTTSPEQGDTDVITTGDGADVVLGGSAGDLVLASAEDAAAIALLDLLGAEWLITPPLVADLIATGAGDDARDVVLGDNGRVFYVAGILTLVHTSDPQFGGDDAIVTGNGDDVVMGGSGDDFLLSGGDDNATDFVIGDNGRMTLEGTETFGQGEGASIISFNFDGSSYWTDVTGTAGAPGAAAGNWNNLAGDGYRIFGNEADEPIRFDNGDTAVGVTIAWGVDLDSQCHMGNAHLDTHNDIYPGEDQNLHLFEGYLYAASNETLGVDIKGLSAYYKTYDVYVYLDADNHNSQCGSSVRRITNGTVTYYLDDPDGNTFTGEYIEATSTDPLGSAVGNYVVFRGLTSDFVSIRVDDDTTLGWSFYNHPAITAVQVVGQHHPIDRFETTDPTYGGDDYIASAGGMDVVFGGTGNDTIHTNGEAVAGALDRDLVAGDNGRATLVFGQVRDFRTTFPETGGNDQIITGNGEDIVFGGSGNDDIHTGATGSLENGNVRIISFNFNAGGKESAVSGTAGAVQAGNWNNLVNAKPNWKNLPDYYGNVLFHDGTAATGVWALWGEDLDSWRPHQAGISTHGQIDPDTQNERLFEGYLVSEPRHTLGVNIGGLSNHFDVYDVYVYLDADDSHSDSESSIRRITNGGTTFYLDDADGNAYKGRFVEVTSTTLGTAETGNYVVFRNVSGNTVSIRVESDTTVNPCGHNRPAITGIQIVGGPDKDAIAIGGDFESDAVVGDNGSTRIYDGMLYDLRTTDFGYGGDDHVKTGECADLVLGGSGSDWISGDSGNDLLLGDHARLMLFQGKVIGLEQEKADYEDDGCHGFDPYGVEGIQLLGNEIGGADILIGGEDNDLLYGQFGDDIYVFAGSDLGSDMVVEAGESNPYGIPNDLHDRLDFNSFAIPVRVDLGTTRQVFGESCNDFELELTLSSSTGVEEVVGTVFDDEIEGNARNNTLLGGSGDDLLIGECGDDTIYGGEGDDQVWGNDSDDVVAGEGGNDRIWGGSGDDEIDGGIGDDRLYGEEGDDLIYAGDGNDEVKGSSGNDLISGGDGSDTLWGESGDDIIEGGRGNDSIYGGSGDDQLYGNAGQDYVRGESGDDWLYGGDDNDRLYGDDDGDHLVGGSGDDLIEGGKGEDLLCFPDAENGVEVTITCSGSGWALDGQGGRDTLKSGIEGAFGTPCNDTLIGDDNGNFFDGLAGDDRIEGRGGDDLLYGGEGNDAVLGGSGDDLIEGGSGVDDIDAGHEDDMVLWSVGEGNDTIDFDDGWDTLVVRLDDSDDAVNLSSTAVDRVTVEGSGETSWAMSLYKGDVVEIRTGGGNDVVTVGNLYRTDLNEVVIFLGEGDDRVEGAESRVCVKAYGEAGNDRFIGGAAEDTFDGGTGTDWIDYSTALSEIKVDMKTKAFKDGRGSRDYLQNFENLIGTAFNDEIWGTDDANEIHGLTGHDDVWARGGDDRIYGGAGNDDLYGDEGNDALMGADGNDKLYGGNGNDALFGESGNDTLDGGYDHDAIIGGDGDDALKGDRGHDILLGGMGADTLDGGSDDDIVIGGFTTYDADYVVLGNIMTLWRDSADYGTALSVIRAQYLQAGVTVFDDGARDKLTGSRDMDWFFADRDGQGGDDDWINDLSRYEIVDTL